MHMLGTLQESDMAETLMVLAGGNAGNAARHFAKADLDAGNIGGALAWARVIEAAEILLRDLSQAELARARSARGLRGPQLDQATYELVRISSIEAKPAFIERPPADSQAASSQADQTRGTSAEARQSVTIVTAIAPRMRRVSRAVRADWPAEKAAA
jgi:hypothetical protein